MKNLISSLKFTPNMMCSTAPSGFSALDVCAEVIDAYKKRFVKGVVSDKSLWRIHSENIHKDFLGILKKGKAQDLSNYVSKVHHQPILQGYDQHMGITQKLDEDKLHHGMQSRQIYCGLIQLAASVGVTRLFNFEQPHNFPYLDQDHTVEMAKGAFAELGIGDIPTTGQGAYGLETPFGLLSLRHVIALGYLREIKAVMKYSGRQYDQIVEIGGGSGRTAFHAARDLKMRYSIIDLPAVSVIQYLLLRGNNVPARLWENTVPERGHVNLMSAFKKHDPQVFQNALFVNFDSFVEMSAETQADYVRLIRDAGADLLSINQEANTTMNAAGDRQNWNIQKQFQGGYSAGPRQLFWEREGYITQAFFKD